MTKYHSLFRVKFIGGLQYRAAAWAGIVTQFVWGFLEILMFRAFYQSDASAFPMTFEATVSYVWLQQAFLALYMIWFWENDIFENIQSGNVSYELVRPISVYNMWFVRGIATRVSRTVLRCLPILIVAVLLPKPFKLMAPSSIGVFSLFIVTMCLSLLVIISLNMIIYFLSFYTINAFGLRMIFQSIGSLLSGEILPLPFFPASLARILAFLPFASIQNVPFRVYSGDLTGESLIQSVLLQFFWIITLVMLGKLLERNVVKKVVIQGG
ncbi:ABC-2 family transporter protein [Vagococcus sp. BWB3-3]|uniref:ABC-2 family transporter protein n=1 Tax=Vagococcus allomyrinae TaxID=2794353 RepID=A0A940SV15_9ENTE|nr:ABC-2 family transporter protein [Vagococcus allomyrinae]MBP1041865.1 ABC-2 family transporter protein [Vagococcus allomyrinae]